MASVAIGIVGLPNVGKSTLFNALTNASVPAENYPFCTIDPNTGTVPLYDNRLDRLAAESGSEKTIYATVSFTDIAGLVQGASTGDGLGNLFLSHIRDTTALVHVVRCFDNDDITHVNGSVNPAYDASIIDTELILADLSTVTTAIEKQKKRAKSADAAAKKLLAELLKIQAYLSEEKSLRHCEESDQLDADVMLTYGLLSAKPMIYIANVSPDAYQSGNAYQQQLETYASKDQVIRLSGELESEAAILDGDDQTDYLAEYGVEKSGLTVLAQAGFEALDLQVYFTTGPKESRAWTIKRGTLAPQAAGVIHTDFERGFIRANIIGFDDWQRAGSTKAAKAAGLLRQEGKQYSMADADITEFLFNV